MTSLRDLTFQELENLIVSLGEKKFRATQVFSWLHKGVRSFDEMTNVSKALKDKLSENYYVSTMEIVKKLESRIDKTKKYLFKLHDGNMVESVVMYYKHGITICVSSQVGCAMGCKFCASTIGGLVRSLTPGEILDQIIFAGLDIGERISNIVMMGIGEPLANFENVCKFLNIVNDEHGINIGYRHISLSTCGIVPKILELSKLDIPITLSISLHACDDEGRSSIMPVNNTYNISSLLDACKSYQKVTGRRISFEYAIIKGVNDTDSHAAKLASLLKGILCHINIIPVNKVEENSFEKPNDERIKSFIKTIEKNGITATVRRKLGSDINASCGQLRKNNLERM
ncbi:MAG: 23S rRNA (adenine(2503)-C(2))-methyltransferase RlmN [Clostridia bacterium]|nr:23S rRNA (adenine(2503)-C(2))-methyltransferase RlmN [Clostridia bacterium]